MSKTKKETKDLILEAIMETKAFDTVILKVGDLASITDYFIICSGRSSRQVQAIADNIHMKVKQEGGELPLGTEGKSGGQWTLLDYSDVIVHIFYHPVREIYDLEGLWVEAEKIEINGDENTAEISG